MPLRTFDVISRTRWPRCVRVQKLSGTPRTRFRAASRFCLKPSRGGPAPSGSQATWVPMNSPSSPPCVSMAKHRALQQSTSTMIASYCLPQCSRTAPPFWFASDNTKRDREVVIAAARQNWPHSEIRVSRSSSGPRCDARRCVARWRCFCFRSARC